MYDELISALRNNADHYGFMGENGLVHLLTNAADTLGRYAEASWWEERGQELINELKGYEVNNHDNDK